MEFQPLIPSIRVIRSGGVFQGAPAESATEPDRRATVVYPVSAQFDLNDWSPGAYETKELFLLHPYDGTLDAVLVGVTPDTPVPAPGTSTDYYEFQVFQRRDGQIVSETEPELFTQMLEHPPRSLNLPNTSGEGGIFVRVTCKGYDGLLLVTAILTTSAIP